MPGAAACLLPTSATSKPAPQRTETNDRNFEDNGIKYTIKDGIVFDSKQLLADVAAMVAKQKAAIKGPVTLQGIPSTCETK